jgi:hypothetical protein
MLAQSIGEEARALSCAASNPINAHFASTYENKREREMDTLSNDSIINESRSLCDKRAKAINKHIQMVRVQNDSTTKSNSHYH